MGHFDQIPSGRPNGFHLGPKAPWKGNQPSRRVFRPDLFAIWGASTTLELSTDPDMRLRVEHITHYQYDSPVRYALQRAKLTPKERPGQQLIHGWTIAIEGGAQQLHYSDHHGNGVDLIAVNGGTSELVIQIGRAHVRTPVNNAQHVCS